MALITKVETRLTVVGIIQLRELRPRNGRISGRSSALVVYFCFSLIAQWAEGKFVAVILWSDRYRNNEHD